MIPWIIVSVGVCLLLLFAVAWAGVFLLPAPKGLPILLYHKVSENMNDKLTISTEKLDQQLAFIVQQGYTPISFSDLKDCIAGGSPLPSKPVLVTFDDGYQSMSRLAYPLLKKHRFKATVFLPTKYIGKFNAWDGGTEKLMDYESIRDAAGGLVEFGLHSHQHQSYNSYSAEEMNADIAQCIATLEQNKCSFVRVFAYPYGAVPASREAKGAARSAFRNHGIEFALRIGSRVNTFPLRDVYEMKRTGINGTDSFRQFKIKLTRGRNKLF